MEQRKRVSDTALEALRYGWFTEFEFDLPGTTPPTLEKCLIVRAGVGVVIKSFQLGKTFGLKGTL